MTILVWIVVVIVIAFMLMLAVLMQKKMGLHHGFPQLTLSQASAAQCNCARSQPCNQDPSTFYTQSYTSPGGIRFVAHASVPMEALHKSGTLLDKMLTPDMSAAIRAMPDFRLIVMGAQQVTTDLPEYCWLKDICLPDGRCYDTTRGIGAASLGAPGVIAAENVLCLPDDPYPLESITVHEFAHTLLDIVIRAKFPDQAQRIGAAWSNAQQQAIYPTSSYIGSSEAEYWAESVQAWFGATLRTDYATDGVKRRRDVKERDPTLAKVLKDIFKDLPELGCTAAKGRLCC